MKRKHYCTFIGSQTKKMTYLGKEREFIDLNFIEYINGDLTNAKAFHTFTTVNKVRKALDYRGISSLVINQRYIIWEQDYKGDKKLKFNGVEIWE